MKINFLLAVIIVHALVEGDSANDWHHCADARSRLPPMLLFCPAGSLTCDPICRPDLVLFLPGIPVLQGVSMAATVADSRPLTISKMGARNLVDRVVA